MVKFYRKNFSLSDLWVSSNEKLSDFYASSWQRGDSPVPLLVIRLILASLALSILVWSIVQGLNVYWLVYLTNWGIILVFLMLFSGLCVSIASLFKGQPESGEVPWYMSIYWFLYNITVTIALMITALYWILLYDPAATEESQDPRVFWLDVMTHGANSCIVTCEVLLSRTPVRLFHVYQPLGVGLWYAAFTAVYYAAGGTDGNGNPYIYAVLDWRQGRQSGIVLAGSTAGLLILYVTVWTVAFFRDKLSALLRTTSHDLPLAPPDSLSQHRIV